ncbi:MAG: hypothetical protein C0436_02535 [Alphaproteobacteria bacterium]|nr:hypothetical protein [Alphaproteobacteria bacterium]
MKTSFIVLCIICALPSWAEARPVSFPGGWMPMVEVNAHGMNSEIMYSPTARYAVGVRGEYDASDDATLAYATYNRLLYRNNAPASQTNLYVRSGIGNVHAGGDDALAGYLGITADWEDRDYMVAYENHYLMTGLASVDDHFEQRFRVGVAPYRASYEEWQPWLMLQADHQPEADVPLEISPVLRVFNGGPVLAEAGISNKGSVFASLILSF